MSHTKLNSRMMNHLLKDNKLDENTLLHNLIINKQKSKSTSKNKSKNNNESSQKWPSYVFGNEENINDSDNSIKINNEPEDANKTLINKVSHKENSKIKKYDNHDGPESERQKILIDKAQSDVNNLNDILPNKNINKKDGKNEIPLIKQNKINSRKSSTDPIGHNSNSNSNISRITQNIQNSNSLNNNNIILIDKNLNAKETKRDSNLNETLNKIKILELIQPNKQKANLNITNIKNNERYENNNESINSNDDGNKINILNTQNINKISSTNDKKSTANDFVVITETHDKKNLSDWDNKIPNTQGSIVEYKNKSFPTNEANCENKIIELKSNNQKSPKENNMLVSGRFYKQNSHDSIEDKNTQAQLLKGREKNICNSKSINSNNNENKALKSESISNHKSQSESNLMVSDTIYNKKSEDNIGSNIPLVHSSKSEYKTGSLSKSISTSNENELPQSKLHNKKSVNENNILASESVDKYNLNDYAENKTPPTKPIKSETNKGERSTSIININEIELPQSKSNNQKSLCDNNILVGDTLDDKNLDNYKGNMKISAQPSKGGYKKGSLPKGNNSSNDENQLPSSKINNLIEDIFASDTFDNKDLKESREGKILPNQPLKSHSKNGSNSKSINNKNKKIEFSQSKLMNQKHVIEKNEELQVLKSNGVQNNNFILKDLDENSIKNAKSINFSNNVKIEFSKQNLGKNNKIDKPPNNKNDKVIELTINKIKLDHELSKNESDFEVGRKHLEMDSKDQNKQEQIYNDRKKMVKGTKGQDGNFIINTKIITSHDDLELSKKLDIPNGINKNFHNKKYQNNKRASRLNQDQINNKPKSTNLISCKSNHISKEKEHKSAKKISLIPLQKEKEHENNISTNQMNGDDENYSPVKIRGVTRRLEEKDFEKYDIQKLYYNISKEYSHIKISDDKAFLDRMEFYSFKKHIRENKLNELIDSKVAKISEKEKQSTFNNLIEDANRRNEVKQKIEMLQDDKNDPVNLLSDEDINFNQIVLRKKVSSKDWDQVYKQRFEEKMNLKNRKIQKEKALKEILLREEEDKIIEQIQHSSKKISPEASVMRMNQKEKNISQVDTTAARNTKSNNNSIIQLHTNNINSNIENLKFQKSLSASKNTNCNCDSYNMDNRMLNIEDSKLNNNISPSNSPKRSPNNSQLKKEKYSHISSKYYDEKNYKKKLKNFSLNPTNTQKSLIKNNSMIFLNNHKLFYENQYKEIIGVNVVKTTNLLSSQSNLINSPFGSRSGSNDHCNEQMNKNLNIISLINSNFIDNNEPNIVNGNNKLTRIKDLDFHKEKIEKNRQKNNFYVPDYMTTRIVENILDRKQN